MSPTVFQKWPVKRGSLSDKMSMGMPNCVMTWSCMSCAKPSAVMVTAVGTSLTIFVHLSTTGRMLSCPSEVSGKHVIRSTEIFCHGTSDNAGKVSSPCDEV